MAGLESVGRSFTRLFRRKEAGVDETPEGYLKLTTKCLEQARRMSISTSLKFNHGQCKYLVVRLESAVQSARSLLEPRRGFSFGDFDSLQVFKFLFALAEEVVTFIQSCCKDAWIQTAVFLTNVSKHVSSVGFNLKVFTIVFSESNERNGNRALTVTEVASVSEAEVETVEEEASDDKRTLLMKLTSFIVSSKSNTKNDRQLAIFLLERLLESSPDSLCERFFTSLEQMESLGRGATAIVHKAVWLGAKVATKTFIGPNNSDFKKEVSILSRLSHPNIICLFGYGMRKQTCFIVMEVMDGDLFSLIFKRLKGDGSHGSPFTILEAVDIMHQVAEGVFYLHQNRIVHRDLKSHNILFRCVKAPGMEIEYVLVKVADFGLSKIKERSSTFSNQTPNMGTARWMAPEMILLSDDDRRAKLSYSEDSLRYPFKSDVYSFAMVCYEILTGYQPFLSIESLIEVKKKVLDGYRPQLPDQCPINLKTLIENCWSSEPSARPSFGDICEELRYLKYLLMKSVIGTVGISSGVIDVPSIARAYTLAEVTAVTRNFNTEIGRGEFGPFYYGKLPDGREVSVMVADGSHFGEKEVRILSRMHQRNLVALVGYCLEQNKKFLLYEYMKNGSLSDQLYGNFPSACTILDWKIRLRIAVNAAQGLEYLHTMCNPRLVHGDVKSANILLPLNYEAKVAGLGVTKLLSDAQATATSIAVVGTAGYVDPEYLSSGYLSIKSDVYSFGVVLLELITGRRPYDSLNPTKEHIHNVGLVYNWVRESAMKDAIVLDPAILDPAVQASHPNTEAVWKVVEIALRSIEPESIHRPTMTEVVEELQEAVTLEEHSDFSSRPSSSGASTDFTFNSI